MTVTGRTGRPIEIIRENSVFLAAGDVAIAVEYRTLNFAVLTAAQQRHPDSKTLAAAIERLRLENPDGALADEGLSVHVLGPRHEDEEYLRFDLFPDDPHYHYISPVGDWQVEKHSYDETANGDMFEWVLARLRTNLPAMLRRAGASGLAESLDQEEIDRLIPDLAAAAAKLQRSFTEVAT